jgi:NTE family protein
VFPLSVLGLVRGVMGHRNYLVDALGLRTLIERAEFGFGNLEDAPIPVHTVATDLLTAQPVVLSRGDTTQALLASAAIPGVFPPVNIGDRLLVDGGVLANLPVLQAVGLGATRLFVLPAMSEEVDMVSGGAIDVLQRSIMVATAALTRADLATVAASIEVHVLPVPTTTPLSIFDFGQTPALIEGAYLSSSALLAASEYELAS